MEGYYKIDRYAVARWQLVRAAQILAQAIVNYVRELRRKVIG